jgi:muramoyltetrapeptide carboxypeptidase LdcA involved in peptidoglycan recycling
VTAPSSGAAEPLWPRLDVVIAHLREQGFVVEEGRCLREQHKDASASAAERASELMSAFLRDDIDAVFPPWGGELAIELLELMDFGALSATRPKWLLGFSDLSTLMLPLRLLAGWASAHGPNLMDLSPTQWDELTVSTLTPLLAAPGTRVEQRSSTLYRGKEWTDFAVDPRAAKPR